MCVTAAELLINGHRLSVRQHQAKCVNAALCTQAVTVSPERLLLVNTTSTGQSQCGGQYI